MNEEIEKLITAKNEIFKKYLKSKQNCYYTNKYKTLQGKLENVIESSKQVFYRRVSLERSSNITSSVCVCFFPFTVKASAG